jgi:hypothetical protein
MKTIEDIQDQLFKIKDKIRWAKMFLAHAEADALELDEKILDYKEDIWLESLKEKRR